LEGGEGPCNIPEIPDSSDAPSKIVAQVLRLQGIKADERDAADLIDALREAGFAFVPIEPTGEMKDAGAETYGVHEPAIGSLPLSTINGQPSKAWRAMIKAALSANPPPGDEQARDDKRHNGETE
jgi:hypothetical protein